MGERGFGPLWRFLAGNVQGCHGYQFRHSPNLASKTQKPFVPTSYFVGSKGSWLFVLGWASPVQLSNEYYQARRKVSSNFEAQSMKSKKQKPKREGPLRIPLPFEQAVKGLLGVKPEAKGKQRKGKVSCVKNSKD